ncbi:aromatic amino acid ammonia-lyase [Pelagibius sp.]|uniref:aromatic amino acid ammonia-lyase n=1 Tax=Pelagibius sp. TaxID=1931238 RepID=UPI0026158310|nr:aromatic amino acid ammonia-lyase [Pelagibius sp.]
MTDSPSPIALTGQDLDAGTLAEIARGGRGVAIAPEAKARLAAGRSVVEAAIDSGAAVYGITRGLGPQVTHSLDRGELADFSLRTLRGRAHGIGPALPRDQVRAVMAVRLNGLLNGGAGITPAIAELLAEFLNRKLHPVLPSIGSVGASDLLILAHLGLALVGEGEIESGGVARPAAEALAEAGLTPATLGPKDGIALCSASSFSAGLAGLLLHDTAALWRLAQLAAALSLEAYRGNLSPHDPAVTAARPAPGQTAASAHLLETLTGSALMDQSQARRLQDPISLRAVGPVHGSLLAALQFLAPAVLAEINGAGDNPLVVAERETLIANANFHTPALALALETLGQAFAQTGALSVSRAAKHLTPRLSDLPDSLSPRGPGNTGYAPFLKTGEALLQELRHLAQPAIPDLRWAADGVEDDITAAPLAAKKATDALGRLRLLLGVELMVAAQALELRAPEGVASVVADALQSIRTAVPRLDEDRSLAGDLERLDRDLLQTGLLLSQARVPPLPD